MPLVYICLYLGEFFLPIISYFLLQTFIFHFFHSEKTIYHVFQCQLSIGELLVFAYLRSPLSLLYLRIITFLGRVSQIVGILPFSILHISYRSLLACNFSAEKSTNTLSGVPLYDSSFFSFNLQNSFFISNFPIFIMPYLGVVSSCSSCLELCVSWT